MRTKKERETYARDFAEQTDEDAKKATAIAEQRRKVNAVFAADKTVKSAGHLKKESYVSCPVYPAGSRTSGAENCDLQISRAGRGIPPSGSLSFRSGRNGA